MKILHLDENHSVLEEKLRLAGFENVTNYTDSKSQIEDIIEDYDGLVVRSRFKLDHKFLSRATRLKCIGRVGAGLENIDLDAARELGITCFNAPEDNRNAVGEHSIGMLLSLLNHLSKADLQVRNGVWDREGNRGLELEGKTVGIIGYGNMGKSFAKKLQGFECTVLCHDLINGVGDKYARQVSLEELQQKTQILSLHTPQTPLTIGMVNSEFIDKFVNPFYLINTARGKSVVTSDLVQALESGKILGAGLDVLEFEKSSFENLYTADNIPESFMKLLNMENVLLSPHVAGWTVESKYKLAVTIADKMINHLNGF